MNLLGPHFRSLAAIVLLAAIGGCATGASDKGFLNPGDDGSVAPLPRESGGTQSSADASSRREAFELDAASDLAADATRSLDAFAEPEGGTNGEANQDSGSGSSGDAGDAGDAADDGTSEGGAGGTGDDAPAPLTPSAGDLLITEVMSYPWGPEPQSEWFEVYNRTASPLLLSGLTIRDGYPRAHVIASNPPVVAPPVAYVVLVRDGLAATSNLLPPAAIVYEYGAGLPVDQGIQLQNDASGDVSLWSGTTLLVDVPYGPWGMASVGQSIELASLQSAPNAAQAWCLGQYPWAAGADYGTPGRASDCP